ncbi:MAG TPA: SpoIIE family protein phosphatase [Verrucomicrobiae bacterium]
MNSHLESPAGNLLSGIPASDVLNSLADGVYITDVDRKIVFWNQAAERMTGWRAADVVGRNCADNILVHMDKDGHALCGQEFCPLHRSIVTGQPSADSVLVLAQCKSQLRMPVEVSVSPIRNGAGQVIGGIEVFRDLREFMHDLLRAKGIQELSMNNPLPKDPRVEFEVRYQARELVGGDFYRIERQGADRYALLVADAMGHGVAAALYTMQLRTLWDDHREELQSPARFLSLLSHRLHTLVRDAGYFATAACATFDAATGALRCVRAGHPAPLLSRCDGSSEAVGQSQPALGMVPNHIYTESAVSLAPGDAFLMFTDGAIELFDSQEREMGIAGLEQILRKLDHNEVNSFHLVNVEEELLRFTDEIHLPDDLTLLKLWRRS